MMLSSPQVGSGNSRAAGSKAENGGEGSRGSVSSAPVSNRRFSFVPLKVKQRRTEGLQPPKNENPSQGVKDCLGCMSLDISGREGTPLLGTAEQRGLLSQQDGNCAHRGADTKGLSGNLPRPDSSYTM